MDARTNEPKPLPAEPARCADMFAALGSEVRLRILRLCLHDALTNKEIAERLGQDPATTLHHVRTLCASGFRFILNS